MTQVTTAQALFWIIVLANFAVIVFLAVQAYLVRVDNREHLKVTRALYDLSKQVNEETRRDVRRIETKVEDKAEELKTELVQGVVAKVLPPPPNPPAPPKPLLVWFGTSGMVLAALGANWAASVLTPNTFPPEVTTVTRLKGAETFEAAMAAMRDKNYETALKGFLKASDQGAEPGECLPRAAECCLYLRKYDQAIGLCQRAVARVPRCGAAYHVKGLVHEACGNPGGARREWETAAAFGYRAARLKLGLVPTS